MDISTVTEGMAEEFTKKPFDFVTRRDIEIRLVQRLRSELLTDDASIAEMQGVGIQGNPVSYKEDYVATMQTKLRENRGIDRVHTQVKFEQYDHHYDVVVFSDSIDHSIQLSNNGSMRFNENDVDAVINLEFVINRPYFPTEHSLRDDRVLRLDEDELRDGLKKHRNNIDTDLEHLNRLPADVDTSYLLCSNMNYLFREPLTRAEQDQEIKIRVGEVAQNWISDAAGDATVYYAHPRGYARIAK